MISKSDFEEINQDSNVFEKDLSVLIATLNAVVSAFEGVDEEIKKAISGKPLRDESIQNFEAMESRGRNLFNRIYTKHSDIVYGKMFELYPDMARFVITEYYGKLMSESKILNEMETELCMIGALVPLNVPPQLKSHVIGAKRLGASELQINAALKIANIIITKHL
ncbi:hypothetical protein AYI70_g7110 [Smittium culicis]|uniref:Carboxymuconolactone decarboxylase-like domain-containing protein n=1 Tax=Smittium culicis TaxID=133412 RepID=A0A1R1XM12_9FUNG|nr:hypothetical protein AYI70_g7110 [Smittium culicis]